MRGIPCSYNIMDTSTLIYLKEEISLYLSKNSTDLQTVSVSTNMKTKRIHLRCLDFDSHSLHLVVRMVITSDCLSEMSFNSLTRASVLVVLF
jgi:hypothetical protein